MLINNVELSSLGVQLFDRVLSSNTVETTQDWLEGDIQPTFIRQQDKFKKMTLRFLVTEQDEEAAFLTMSKLTMLLRKASIIFDDMDLIFDVTLDGKALQERLKNGNFILTVNLKSDYAKGQTEIYTTDARATDYFNLTVLYYMKGNILLGQEKVLIRASQFDNLVNTFESVGIELDKYQPDHYNNGTVTNFSNRELTYDNLYQVQTLIVNYSPVVYKKEVQYFLDNDGIYSPITTVTIGFTKEDVDRRSTIGQLVDLTANRPDGYRAYTNFNMDFNFDNLMAFSPLCVYFDRIMNERAKNIKVNYFVENDEGDFIELNTQIVYIREGSVVDGKQVKDLFNVNAYKPEKYYEDGICEQDLTELVTYDSILDEYNVKYKLTEQLILVEYYLNNYPNWSRVTTASYKVKYRTSLETASDVVTAVGIDLNKYKTEDYESGKIYNGSSIVDYDSLLSIGILQVYYTPKDYNLRVSFMQEDVGLGYKDFTINAYMFLHGPMLAEVIDVNAMRPEGYIFSPELSYDGDITLEALLAAAPIVITYVQVQELRTKSLIVKYKQQLAAGYSTINTSVLTIEEAAVGAGIKASDLININLYRPQYYNEGILDNIAANAYLTFDQIQGTYEVIYMASTYTTQVRYFTDTVDNYNWVGSAALNYRIIDFTTETTLVDLGLNINAFKPTYCETGVVDYRGPITFNTLLNLDAINVTYKSAMEPDDPEDIDYPHRILWLQHNDMGNYEQNFPSWTLNHAYINTGVTVQDMSKLTVLCDTFRVFETEPLYNVNVEDAYLFGSITPKGSYYIKYVNNTSFKPQSLLTGVNTFNVCAGYGTPELQLEETASEGFSANTGITASARDGYSYATLTYTNLVQSNAAPMEVPLFLFACDYNGFYKGGIAGVGIKRCKIYYENILIRDFIPVAFYDKIGDRIAPSNCLYDKVTQTFFEDGTGKDSFNIMDDPDYTDTNPEHQIGCCYVNYYKDDTLFNSATIWFRGSDFVDKEFDLYEKFFVDYYQPAYYSSGTITDLAQISKVEFNTLVNKVFTVKYESIGYSITVNYWKDNKEAPGNLIASEKIGLTEATFLQAPTFGEIIPLNKYKPDSYRATYTYPEQKVTLNRILQHSPYDIIYEKVENPQKFTTTIRYIRKVFGISPLEPIQSYRTIATETIELDETQFAEGVFIEDFINFNKYWPQSPASVWQEYYYKGRPFEWYLKDEMLSTPAKLKSQYIVAYDPKPVYVNIFYYTDVVEEDNYIASATWTIYIDDFPEDGQFQIVDNLPNRFLNQYRPAICDSGRFEKPDMMWTFDTIAAEGVINIIYDTLDEPHDPENAMFPNKVLWFNRKPRERWDITFPNIDMYQYAPDPTAMNIYTPYLDLGYQPKEIGRLRIETKAYALNSGNTMGSQINDYGYAGDSYDYFLGYYGALHADEVITQIGQDGGAVKKTILLNAPTSVAGLIDPHSPGSSGWMAIAGHTVQSAGLVYTTPMPQYFDGHPGYNLNIGGMNDGWNEESVREITMGFRNGFPFLQDEDLRVHSLYKDYIYNKAEGFYHTGFWVTDPYKDGGGHQGLTPNPSRMFDYGSRDMYKAVCYNPLTVTVDAFHNYMEVYDYSNDQMPEFWNIENKDTDVFTERCTPKGTISLFITTNPDTGKVNWLSSDNGTYLGMAGLGHGLNLVGLGNPWSDKFEPSITFTEQVITGTTETGEPIYENKVKTTSIAYAQYQQGIFNSPMRCCVWYVKIWDRDRLVRNLIPVERGDMIYDYEAPATGMFDIVTETFFGNRNEGGSYTNLTKHGGTITPFEITVQPNEVAKLHATLDPTVWGSIPVNYYDDNNEFLGSQFVVIPVHWNPNNISLPNLLHYNDFKPNEFYHDGMIDVDMGLYDEEEILEAIYNKGVINVYYKLQTYAKTVVFYRSNHRVASKDVFFTVKDIDEAETLADLDLDVDMYYTPHFSHGRVRFNEDILKSDDIKAFIDAPSPVVVYEKLTKEEAPNIFYQEYYRGGASEDNITLDPDDHNYLICDMDAVVLNPRGVIRYANHYHSVLYEDEKQDYFLEYQVDMRANYVPIHRGPARAYPVLANIVDKGRYTIVEEQRGWGRLKEYPTGWVLLGYTKRATGPGQNPPYDHPSLKDYVIPYAETITITRMTVDRLWAYVPEYACWVKTEEISFNQWGRLYNSLAIITLDLNDTDWSKANSLSAVGIYPEVYRLRYHDFCGYTYNGPWTYAAFSDIHELDFIYPETIYTYNIIYYKDFKMPAYEVGRESFSCSVGDWNPDWDTFIATSYIQGQIPRLYRETPLTLNWDYFGVPRNKYKPSEDYDDGMFLWNPRTWDNEDVWFTFEEITGTGVQYILYIKTITQYKARYNMAWTSLPIGITDFALCPKREPGLATYDIEFKWQDLGGQDSKILYQWGATSINSGEIRVENTSLYTRDVYDTHTYNGYPLYRYRQGFIMTPGGSLEIKWPHYYWGPSTNRQTIYNTLNCFSYTYSNHDKYSVYNIANISNRRNMTVVAAYGKPLSHYQSPFQALSGDRIVFGATSITRATDVTLSKYYKLGKFDTAQDHFLNPPDQTGSTSPNEYVYNQVMDMSYIEVGAGGAVKDATYTTYNGYYNMKETVWYHVKSWDKYVLQHYYVPVPRGFDLPDGTKCPYATFLDRLTGKIGTPYYPYQYQSVGTGNEPKIYKIDDDMTGDEVDLFEAWEFDWEPVNGLVYLTEETMGYSAPTEISLRRMSYRKGYIMPVMRMATDASVKGLWYFNGYAWLKCDNNMRECSEYPYAEFVPETGYTVVKANWTGAAQNEIVVTDTYYAPRRTHKNDVVTEYGRNLRISTEEAYKYYGSVTGTDATSGYVWLGKYWMPVDYTTFQERRYYPAKEMVVSVSEIQLYTQPSILDKYKAEYNIFLGDRVYLLSEVWANSRWKKILVNNEQMWIFGNQLSEVV